MADSIMKVSLMNNTLSDYVIFLMALALGCVIISVVKRVVVKLLKKWASKTENKADDFIVRLLSRTLVPVMYFGVFYLSVQNLSMRPVLYRFINISGIILLTLFSIYFFVSLVTYLLEVYWLKKENNDSRIQSIKGILMVIKVVIWGVGITFLLDNLGFRISAVIAGLGIGGVAIALAAQAVLGDLFSYFAIFFDRPFEVGDFIIVGDYLGAVEHVGIKTTRLRSLGGEQVVFSNTDLTNSRVRNYKRMQKRRVLFRLGVTYQTPHDKLKEIPGLVKGIIEGMDDTVFDRAHFFEYGNFALIFEVVYYVTGSDYNKYMNIQQEINLSIHSEFEKRGIEFAYPTQTVFLRKDQQ